MLNHVISALSMFDALSPIRYKLEQFVAGRSIPNVANIPNRRLLRDCIEQHDDEETSTATFDHTVWDGLLKKYIVEGCTFGKVQNVNGLDYDAIALDPDFDVYMKQLEEACPDELCKLEQLAFWMNAYNALCVNIIVQYEKKSNPENIKLSSINQITNPEQGPVWDQVAGYVNGREISLNYIEHEMLRKQWNEPMIHACIVCASASCPNLRREAFTTTPMSNTQENDSSSSSGDIAITKTNRLEQQMISQTKEWLQNDSKGLKYDPISDRLQLSRIFLWFEDDFSDRCEWGGVRKWISTFFTPGDGNSYDGSREGPTTVRYFDYDWQIIRARSTKSQ